MEKLMEYLNQFSEKGMFNYFPNKNLKSVIRENNVPNLPGVYLIHGHANKGKQLIYIGKSGTMNNDGSYKPQGLALRLSKKQDGMYRQEFFNLIMSENNYQYLEFIWAVTFNSHCQLIPQKAEADLVQLFFNAQKSLPKYNKSY